MTRTLADELGPWLLDLTRVTSIGNQLLERLGWLHEKGQVHPNVSPPAITIVGNFDEAMLSDIDVPLSREAPWAAPETIRDGTLTVASNLYSVAAIVKALLAGRGHPTVDRWLDVDPSKRPASAKAMVDELFGIGWVTNAVGRVTAYRRAFEPTDAKEAALVDALRAKPNDAATRAVYADWLEGNGHVDRAVMLRGGSSTTDRDSIPWRAIVSRAPIVVCYSLEECPRSWDALTPTTFDNQRSCAKCSARVTYGTSMLDAELHGIRRDTIVFDDSLPSEEATKLYQANRPRSGTYNPPMPVAQMTYNPPPPPPPPVVGPPGNPPLRRGYGDDTTVLGRFFGWFRRKK